MCLTKFACGKLFSKTELVFDKLCAFQQLHEMFKDLALMVEQQGEMLNNIEKNVEQVRKLGKPIFAELSLV